MENKNTELNSSFSGVKVHPNAFVDPSAELHDGVIVSQGAIIGPDVTIGKGTCLLYTSPSPRDTMSSRMPSSA